MVRNNNSCSTTSNITGTGSTGSTSSSGSKGFTSSTAATIVATIISTTCFGKPSTRGLKKALGSVPVRSLAVELCVVRLRSALLVVIGPAVRFAMPIVSHSLNAAAFAALAFADTATTEATKTCEAQAAASGSSLSAS